jgi:hypothetical protein
MTPRQKAIELVNKFSNVGLQQKNESITCALIAVDELMHQAENLYHNEDIIKGAKLYLQEVKQELLNNLRNKNYIGRKIKGFKFEHNTDTIVWNSRKEKYIGKIGLIVNEYAQFVKVKFDSKQLVYYPISMVEENLLSEEPKLPKKG